MKTKSSPIVRFLLYSGGANPSIMERSSPAEITTYTGYGIMVLIPALLAFLSGGFAIYFFTGSKAFALLFGLLWAFIIYNIDRLIVAHTTPGRYGIGFFSRLFIAVIISFTIPEPLLIGIFNEAIQTEVLARRDSNSQKIEEKYQNEYASIESRKYEVHQTYRHYQDEWIREVDGTGGSRILNSGPIARAKKDRLAEEERIRNQKIADLDAELKKLSLREQTEIEYARELVSADFLSQMMILHDLTKKHTMAFFAVWLLRMLFLSIEVIPVLIKATGKSKPVYDSITEMIAKKTIAFAELEINSEIKERFVESDVKDKQIELNGGLTKKKLSINSAIEEAELLVDFNKHSNQAHTNLISNNLSHQNPANDRLTDTLEGIVKHTLGKFSLNGSSIH